MNVGGDEGTILASQNRSGVGIQRTSRQVIEEESHTHVTFGRQPAALASERRRPLPHAADERLKHGMNLEVSGHGVADDLSVGSRSAPHQFGPQHHHDGQQRSEKPTPHLPSPGRQPCVREGGGKVGRSPSAAKRV